MKKPSMQELADLLKDLRPSEKQELLMKGMMYELALLCDTDAEFIASLEEQKAFCIKSLDYCIAETRITLEDKLEIN